MDSSIFREYDIRGLAGKDLSADFAQKLGRAYARFAEAHEKKQALTIAVGRDCRVSGPEYATALMAGLSSMGAKVIDLGETTTPMTYFSLHHLNLDGAIMVTG